jgi:hypothetical protein
MHHTIAGNPDERGAEAIHPIRGFANINLLCRAPLTGVRIEHPHKGLDRIAALIEALQHRHGRPALRRMHCHTNIKGHAGQLEGRMRIAAAQPALRLHRCIGGWRRNG